MHDDIEMHICSAQGNIVLQLVISAAYVHCSVGIAILMSRQTSESITISCSDNVVY